MRKTRVGNRLIGEGEPAFIVAEIGSNHDRNLEQAKRLIASAKECGADAVKFQSFTAEKLVSPKYKAMHDAFKKAELPWEWHEQLARFSGTQDIMFLSTPFDEDAASLLHSLGVPAFKTASGDLTNLPLLRFIAGRKKPIFLSTGMATLNEIGEAVNCIKAQSNRDIVLLHCVSTYPAMMEEANIRAMAGMSETFGLPVGYSDHSMGIIVSLGAVALGACVVEKHITIDRNLPGPDHPYALEASEFKQMVDAIRSLEKALGSGVKAPVPAEMPYLGSARRGVYAAEDIAKGTTITKEMLKIVRPSASLEPKDIDLIVGKVAKESIAAHEPLVFGLWS